MKVLAVIFTIIGLVGSISACCNTQFGIFSGDALYISVSAVVAVISLIVSIMMLVSLTKNRKSILLGILGIFFSGVLSGIFYLIWSPHR